MNFGAASFGPPTTKALAQLEQIRISRGIVQLETWRAIMEAIVSITLPGETLSCPTKSRHISVCIAFYQFAPEKTVQAIEQCAFDELA